MNPAGQSADGIALNIVTFETEQALTNHRFITVASALPGLISSFDPPSAQTGKNQRKASGGRVYCSVESGIGVDANQGVPPWEGCNRSSGKQDCDMDDIELRREVLEELAWAPHLDATNVVATVRDGVVNLTSVVSSLAEKRAAERAVWHVRGVRGIAQEIEVQIPEARRYSDDEIAHQVLNALRWDTQIPQDRVQVTFERGIVTLTGSVDWQFQRAEAEERVQQLSGVRRLDNRIIVVPSVPPDDTKRRIERALHRHAQLHAAKIVVDVEGKKIILTGEVSSVDARHAAEDAAWSAAGVAEVSNGLVVQP